MHYYCILFFVFSYILNVGVYSNISGYMNICLPVDIEKKKNNLLFITPTRAVKLIAINNAVYVTVMFCTDLT